MINFLTATTTTAAAEGTGMDSTVYTLIMLAVMFGMMYILMIRPQKKREKAEKEMRNNLEVGDGITTIGGIVGRVVSIKEDTVLIETGSDRVKIRFLKTAIAKVEKLDMGETKTEAKAEAKAEEEK